MVKRRLNVKLGDAEVLVAMKKADLTKPPAMLETVDTFLGCVPWTKNRTVIVYLREHGRRRYIRIRTFNKHRTMGCWYPSKRVFMVPIDRAPALGKAIIAAGKGRTFGDQPAWWEGFEKQYAALKERKAAEANDTPDVDRCDTP